MIRHPFLFGALALCVLLPSPVLAIVNPSLQPNGIHDRYQVVALLRVDALDEANHTASLSVTQVIKGDYKAEKISITLGESSFTPGESVVAFIGGKGRGAAAKVLIYPGAGRWKTAEILENSDPANPQWKWTADLPRTEMGGTFNGRVDRLAEMMTDVGEGRYYFPAGPVARFRSDQKVDQLPKPVRGVAMFDVNGDGKPDLYACSEGGNRLYLQTGTLEFKDSTESLGLGGVVSESVGFADANADGRADLLADGTIFLQQANGTFLKSENLPEVKQKGLVKSSAFAELNGDGYPDVVVAKQDGGLTAYLNPGKSGGNFTDASSKMGLDREESGAKQSGFFSVGDWNGDDRADLFFSVGKGILLLQDDNGHFSPCPSKLRIDFTTYGETKGLTGSGCFAPLWNNGSSDLIVSTDGNMKFISNVAGEPLDFGAFGNEIEEGSDAQLATLAEDLDADGNVDIYCASREDNMHMLYINRGYGSFTVPTKYRKGDDAVFMGEANRRATWGIAAGDLNGDGANDLLLGGSDGTLNLLVNDVLAKRTTKENANYHEQKLSGTKIVTVSVSGKIGVLGAQVILTDEKNRIIGKRVIGANIATGCSGPDTVNLAVRELAGAHKLKVVFSDGKVQEWPVDFSGTEKHITIQAERK
ncbi:MAG: VCBS repeat-containing protein [Opitutaceae bacterium]|nr:VCBS repeat-containing protein [Verrucomicrobiales bacterium]